MLALAGGVAGRRMIDAGLMRLPAAGQGTQRGLDGRGRVGSGPGRSATQARIRRLEVSLRSGARTCSGRGQDQGVDLCSGLDAGLHRALARCSSDPQPDANQRLNAA